MCRRATPPLIGIESTSERLPDTKENVKWARLLRAHKVIRYRIGRYLNHSRKGRGVQVVSEVKPNWPDRGFIKNPKPHRMRDVVVIAARRRAGVHTGLKHRIIGLPAQSPVLMPPNQTIQHVISISENIAHVVKYREAQVVLYERQRWRRKS